MIDYEKMQNALKEKLGGEDGPLETLTFLQIMTQLKLEMSQLKAN